MAVSLRKNPVAGQFQPGTSACSLPGTRLADQTLHDGQYGRRASFVAMDIGHNGGKRGRLDHPCGLADAGLRE